MQKNVIITKFAKMDVSEVTHHVNILYVTEKMMMTIMSQNQTIGANID